GRDGLRQFRLCAIRRHAWQRFAGVCARQIDWREAMKRPTTMRSTDSDISKGIAMRNNKIYVAVLGLQILASICLAQAGNVKKETNGLMAETQTAKPESSITSKFVGAWKLVATEGQQVPKRDRVGLIMYDTTGHMAVQIMPLDRPKFASGNRLQGTQDEI